MKATEELKKEHRGIEIMLKVAEAVSQRLESGQYVQPEHLQQMVEFFQVFADKCHHGKEEDQFFRMLEQTGFAPFAGPIQVMLTEHKQGRGYIKAMLEAAQNYQANPQKASVYFAENARGYVALLSQHIQKEDNVLYPMADKHLSPEEDGKLMDAFKQIEQERIGPGKHEEFHRLLKKLEQIYC
jgi:hemerythrin-like domain-containing protein